MRILIAEDDDVSRLLLERLLQKAGHNIISAKNGLEGLEVFKETEIDMAILDWMMPRMDGIELCQSIRRLEGGTETPTYIIMVTAKSEAEDMIHALSMGVDDFLTKPVDKGLLEKRINAGVKYQNFLKMRAEAGRLPHIVLREEHELLRSMVHIFDDILDKLDSGVPEHVLRWSTSTLTLLTLRLHYEKEELYYQTFVDEITKEQTDWFGQISESSFVTLTEEHDELESHLMNIQGQIDQYFMKKAPDVKALKSSIKFYTDLLLRHIYREENIFFPFANKYITHEDMVDMMDQFEKVNREMGVKEIIRKSEEIHELLGVLTKDGEMEKWRPAD